MADQVNEQSTAYLTISFLNKSGTPTAPASASYRVHDRKSGTQILAPTAITPSGSVEITLPPAINTILDPLLESEMRVVTVEGVYGASDKVTSKFTYEVLNLRFLP